jgi:hypothetical protein
MRVVAAVQVILITVRLFGKIKWAWWWVMLPSILWTAIFLGCVGVVVCIGMKEARRQGPIVDTFGSAKTKLQAYRDIKERN